MNSGCSRHEKSGADERSDFIESSEGIHRLVRSRQQTVEDTKARTAWVERRREKDTGTSTGMDMSKEDTRES